MQNIFTAVLAMLVAFFALAATGFYLRGRKQSRTRGWSLSSVLAALSWDDEDQVRQLEAIGLICKTVSINAPNINAGAIGQGTVAVAGLTPQHRCVVLGAAAPSAAVGVFGARCAAAGTLTVDFFNASAGALDLAVQNFTLFAIPGDLN